MGQRGGEFIIQNFEEYERGRNTQNPNSLIYTKQNSLKENPEVLTNNIQEMRDTKRESRESCNIFVICRNHHACDAWVYPSLQSISVFPPVGCCDTTTMILIVETNNRVTTPTVVHAQDCDRCCETVTICNTCKRKLL